MLWLLNKNLLNNNFIFYQIFDTNNVIYNLDNNVVYNLDNKQPINIPLENYKNIKINFEIKIMGNIIMYKNILDKNYVLTFTKKEIHCKSKNLVLQHEYKLVDNHRLPELTSYDFHYPNIEFDIYYNNDNYNKIFIIQKNNSNNSNTSYFIQNLL